jgi:hypothetical protein
MRHELALTRLGLLASLPPAVVLATAGALVGGPRGAASAAVGAGLVAVNQLAAAGSTAWARTIGPSVVAVGYAFFVVRMFVMFAAFAVVASLTWVHAPMFAIAFCAVLTISLAAECIGYVRGSYVPRWRTAR